MEILTEPTTLHSPASHPIAELSAGLDFYKVTMSQLAFEQEPDVQVTSTFHNRGSQRIMDYVDPTELQERFDEIARCGWSKSELDYLGGLTMNGGQQMLSDDYLSHLRTGRLPDVTVRQDDLTNDLAIETTGTWSRQTFWETVVMSEVSETYFANYLRQNNRNVREIYAEGDRRLDEKIGILQQRPDIKIVDFGTRRRFGLDWQEHVLERLVTECPENLIGTSNVALAAKFGLKPIGTFAHEMPMVYAALADARGQNIRKSHGKFLDDWYQRFGEEYSIALTDTFGTDFFFTEFKAKQAAQWQGTRQDSGDPFSYGNDKLLPFYKRLGIDPKSKLVIFSDNLDMSKIVRLQNEFGDQIHNSEGWGTGLMCDLGLKALNQVMKATRVHDPAIGREAGTVKLSDDAGKHTGSPENIKRYKEIFGNV